MDIENSELLRNFPEISQLGTIRSTVDYEFSDGTDEYTIKKGPAVAVYDVSTDSTTYVDGVDYDLILDSDGDIKSIDWGIGGDTPSDGEIFTIDQEYESVLSRYLESHDAEFENLGDDFEEVVSIRQIDNAADDELDRIGEMFGVLGRRAGRDDDDYQIFLKSIVQSFAGRGSVAGVRFAAAAGLGVTVDNVQIVEDFENLNYEIIVEDWPEHRGSIVEELADLADPSAVDLDLIRYQFLDEASAADAVNVTEGTVVPDEMASDDAVVIDDNKIIVPDEMVSDDAVVIDQNLVTVTDEAGVSDAVDVTIDNVGVLWEQNSWDGMQWTRLNEFDYQTDEQIEIDDLNNTTISTAPEATDDSSVNDTVTVDDNTTTVSEDTGLSDDVSVIFNQTKVNEDVDSSDTATASETSVAWESGTWGTMTWTKAQ
jgi:hypothetical protein